MPVGTGSGEGPLLGCRLVASHGRKRARELSGVSFIIPFMKAPLCDLIISQRAPSPNTFTLWVRISTYEFCRDKNIQSIIPR